MEKNPKGGKTMARGEQAPSGIVNLSPEETRLISGSLLPPPPAPLTKEALQQLEEPGQHMISLKPKFLPNLKSLMFPKMVYEQDMRLVITPLLTYDHDPVAALRLRGARCPSFELPPDIFPRGAPIWKITFLPEELLPMGFDAGGVFGTGVLARKYYPTDLLNAEHRGPTPPLFIGQRSSSYILPKGIQGSQAKGNGNGKAKARGQIQSPPKRIQPLTPAPPPSPAYKRSILKPSAAVTAQMNRLLVLYNVSVIEIVVMPVYRKPPSCYPNAVPVQMQYNMYAPDLSKVIFEMQEINLITVAVISTVHQPNVPEVALSTMGNEFCPRFELPADIFPVNTNRFGPRFLPLRFLPDFCDAGCVFPPGSLPDSVFQGAIRTHVDLEQHHYSMTPPLFVGRRKQQVDKIDSVAMQLKRLALRNMAAAKQYNPNTRVPLPESTKRSNDFKMSAAAGKPKGFVLIESSHVPRGAIPTDFFGAFLMGCFFKIIPKIECIFASSSEDDEDEEEPEFLEVQEEFQEAQEYRDAGLKMDRPNQAGETEFEGEEVEGEEVEGEEVEEVEVEEVEIEEAEIEEAEIEEAEIEEAQVEEVDAEFEVYIIEELDDEDDEEVEIFIIKDAEFEGSLAEEAVSKEAAAEEAFTEATEAENTETKEAVAEESEAEVEVQDNSQYYETKEYVAGEFDASELRYEAEGIEYVDYEEDDRETDAYAANSDECETEEYDPEQTKGSSPQMESHQQVHSLITQAKARKSNLNVSDTDDEKRTGCPGCTKIYSYFTVDSNLDDIAEAAGDLATARFEVIVHPSDLPGINVERAVEQFRQVLECRNEIRAKMTGKLNEHAAKMEWVNKLILASPAPAEMTKCVARKPCSHCGKHH